MGFFDIFRRSPELHFPAVAPNGVPVEYDSSTLKNVLGLPTEDLWRTQPHLRTVVSFLSRNIAQLGLQTFERVTDSDRQRDHDGVTARLLAAPNEKMTTYDLVNALVADKALYDAAYWWVIPDDKRPSGWRIDPLSPSWLLQTVGGDLWGPEFYDFKTGQKRPAQRIRADQVVAFNGWNPGHPSKGSSPVEALKAILAEQMHAYAYRQQVWQRAGRVGDVMERPAGAPTWSEDARRRFQEDWKARWTGNDGPEAGGTPILEDGMTLSKVRFSAHEEEWVEAAKLALSTVAQVYHVNPTMIGLLDNANFSNVREFRRMLYGDTLGPTIAEIESRINTFVLPMIGEKPDRYVEFNIREKLQGSFEEQTQALQSSVGRPWMTADEARGLLNMPSRGGDADELVTPLNVLVGGQASPRDSAPKVIASAGVRVKERAPDSYREQTLRVLTRFFERQAGSVLRALGSKDGAAWWDTERWDTELSDDLYKLGIATSGHVAQSTLERIGVRPDLYDADRTLKFLRAVADSRAGMVNATTRDQIKDALATDDPDHTPARVFDNAKSNRASAASAALVTTFSSFGTSEAASQAVGDKATKTWIVTSRNPRAAHAQMDGETVGISDDFSNGMAWPGDLIGPADGVAGCQCDLQIDIP